MSLETALAENTAAIRELLAMWSKMSPTAPVVVHIPEVQAPVAEAPKPEKKKAAAKAETAPAPAPAPEPTPEPVKAEEPAPAPEPTPEPVKEIPYADVQKAITTFAAANGREATLTKLAAFGVKTGKELKPEQYAGVLETFGA